MIYIQILGAVVVFGGIGSIFYTMGESKGYQQGYEDGLDYGRFLLEKHIRLKGRD